MARIVPRPSRLPDIMRMSFWDAIDRWFEDLKLPEFFEKEHFIVPAFDVSETEEHIIVKADLPGVDVKDLDISIVGNVLTVKGEKKQEKEEKNESYHRIERSYGSFSRSITLPAEVNPEAVEAVYRDGVLKLTIPKAEKSKPKKIEIKTA
ncbi:MAG: Hsp20/alpha crystallin family protein [Thermodesulforhabdaceae bacterium]